MQKNATLQLRMQDGVMIEIYWNIFKSYFSERYEDIPS